VVEPPGHADKLERAATSEPVKEAPAHVA
jgi:hypothetical protein